MTVTRLYLLHISALAFKIKRVIVTVILGRAVAQWLSA